MTRLNHTRNRRRGLILTLTLLTALSSYIEQVLSTPTYSDESNFYLPPLAQRNVGAALRAAYIKPNRMAEIKRSLATLAKNGLMPTMQAHSEFDDNDTVKSDLATIAYVKSYKPKNTDFVMRNHFMNANGDLNPYYKRNIGVLARDGHLKGNSNRKLQKKDVKENEYYLPFFQNPVPPLSEIGPLDYNQIYDYLATVNSGREDRGSAKRNIAALLKQHSLPIARNYPETSTIGDGMKFDDKRGSVGLPNHGLLRDTRNIMDVPTADILKHFIYVPDNTDSDEEIEIFWPNDELVKVDDKKSLGDSTNKVKRHIGSLARIGWLPSFRYSGGRYSRSGRARYLTEDDFTAYRKYPSDENFRIGPYYDPETGADDTDISTSSIFTDAYAPNRKFNPLNNQNSLAYIEHNEKPYPKSLFQDAFGKNRWRPGDGTKSPRYYYFKSMKVPYQESRNKSIKHTNEAVIVKDNYPNFNLPSRKKNYQ